MEYQFRNLYMFGDSFSTPFYCVDPHDSFWGLAAKDLNVDHIINYSHSGFDFNLIIHLLCNEKLDWKNSYFIVGLPPIERISFFIDRLKTPKRWSAKMFDKNFNHWDIGCNSITNIEWFDYVEVFEKDKMFISNYSHEWLEAQALDKVYLLWHFLKSKECQFVIVNLTAPILYQDSWEVGENIMKKTRELKECILFENTLHDLNKKDGIKPVDREITDPCVWYGHHGPIGNRNWYEKIFKPKLSELGWL